MIATITDWAPSIGAVSTRRPFWSVCRSKVLIEGRISTHAPRADQAGDRGAAGLAAGAPRRAALPRRSPAALQRLRHLVPRGPDRRRSGAGARARAATAAGGRPARARLAPVPHPALARSRAPLGRTT